MAAGGMFVASYAASLNSSLRFNLIGKQVQGLFIEKFRMMNVLENAPDKLRQEAYIRQAEQVQKRAPVIRELLDFNIPVDSCELFRKLDRGYQAPYLVGEAPVECLEAGEDPSLGEPGNFFRFYPSSFYNPAGKTII